MNSVHPLTTLNSVIASLQRLRDQFDDGSAVTTDHDLSTAAGQSLVAAQAEKLGFGDRQTLRGRLAGPIGPGAGVILERLPPDAAS